LICQPRTAHEGISGTGSTNIIPIDFNFHDCVLDYSSRKAARASAKERSVGAEYSSEECEQRQEVSHSDSDSD
jgi:hypothetical protein